VRLATATMSPAIVPLVATLALINSVGTLAQAPQAAGLQAASERIAYFYQNPSPTKVAEVLTDLSTLPTDNAAIDPPTVGFLAGAFQKFPNDIDKMISAGLSPHVMGLVAISLKLAGQETRAQSVAGQLKASGAAAPDLSRIPTSLDLVVATGPSEFDLLWGASFATGDPRYCQKILERFAAVADLDDNAPDILAIARAHGTHADNHWIVEKRGVEKARELILVSIALWSLDSNARQHAFVRHAVDNYIATHPTEPASRALAALAQQYGQYDVRKAITLTTTGQGNHSVTVNIEFLNLILGDLMRHAGNYPPHFDPAADRQRAEHDVSGLSSLLDPLSQNFSNNPALLLRIAQVHVVGYNLDIADSVKKVTPAFTTLLKVAPNDPQGNYQYGAFLAATTKDGSAIPHLEKASSLGVQEADYWLGLSYAIAGNKAKAIESLGRYTQHAPADEKAIAMLDAIRHDKFQVKTGKPPSQ
jgi:hypothetical protein